MYRSRRKSKAAAIESHLIETSPKTPEIVADFACHIGENPCWNPFDKRIYWCDIPNGRIFRYNPADCRSEKCYEGGIVGGFTVQSDGSLLLFMASGAIKNWNDGRLDAVVEHIPEELDSRFNDVIADPTGRVLCGTMSTPKSAGRLYRLDCDGRLTLLLEGIGCSNGMAWSLDWKTLYRTDSLARTISRFDYDLDTGCLRNGRVFIRAKEVDGLPDGATMDAEGCLWSAHWGGSCIIRYGQEGEELQRVIFPVNQVSSLIFGGTDYSDLYVTSAGGGNKSTEGQHAGALFRLRNLARGVPDFVSEVHVHGHY